MQLKNITILRGIAALAVTYFHLSNNSNLPAQVAATGKLGYLGVEVFFVISGFILPYSMYQGAYQPTQFGTFIAKRGLRIYPPYVLMVLISVLLMIITKRPVPDAKILAAHGLYLNSIAGYPWVSPVFWTLALEIQFYIYAGLLYKAITAQSTLIFFLLTGFTLACAFVLPASLLPHWFGMFALGILVFRKMVMHLRPVLFWPGLLLITSFIGYANGVYEAVTCMLTALFILYIPVTKNTMLTRAGIWLGTVSYSLYLVHWDFGRTAVAYLRHVPVLGDLSYIKLVLGLGFALLAAWLYHLLVEQPSIRISHRLNYKSHS